MLGLEGFGKPTGYLERQLRRFIGLWEHNRTREIAAVEQVGAWLAANLPQSPPATIVHGDYRLGNTMFARGRAGHASTAILDWEMATIGDPLADIGYMMIHWTQADDVVTSFTSRASPRGRASPPGTSWSPATRSARGGRSARSIGTSRSRCGRRSCSWRATTSARSRARPTIRI